MISEQRYQNRVLYNQRQTSDYIEPVSHDIEGKRDEREDKTSNELISRDAGEIMIYSFRLFFSRGTRRAETRS